MSTIFIQPSIPSMLLHGVSWDTYEQLLLETANQHLRMTYDRGELEFMSPLPKHEKYKVLVRMLIEELGRELKINVVCFGSMTCKRRDLERGLEPDECYYIDKAKSMWKKTEIDFAVDPPPELAVEIDVTSSSLDRQRIYAELGVPELWRYDGRSLRIYHLKKGKYFLRGTSRAFPKLPLKGFQKFLQSWDAYSDSDAWLDDFRSWFRKVVK